MKSKHTKATLYPIPVLAELHIDLEVDDRRVAELERLEASQQRPRLGVLLQSGEDRIGGTAAIVEQLDLLVLQAALSDEVAREDVEDAVAVELDPGLLIRFVVTLEISRHKMCLSTIMVAIVNSHVIAVESHGNTE